MQGLEGTKIGRYTLGRIIGRGGMGTVYEAHDDTGGARVAIKVTDARGARNERHARRLRKLFMNEARAASLLRHPNIVAVLDAGIDDDKWYIVMEHVPGKRTLDHHCQRERLLPVEDVVRLLIECANAFDFAHRRGIVHRDIKPRNVLLTPQAEVKVADFGVALIERPDTEQTQVMGNIGSPLYMAPEQVGGESATAQSDIFALGVVAYQLLTGRHPFQAPSLPGVARRIVHDAHQPLLETRPGLPPLLARVIDRALKKHPAGRYGSALDMAADLALIHEDMSEAGGEETPLRAKLSGVRGLAFFAGFDDGEIVEVLHAGLWQRYDGGEVVAVEGDDGDAFCVLVEGRVGVQREGRELDVLEAGASFGELGFVLHRPRMATIVAHDSVTVLKVRAAVIEHVSSGCRLRLHRAFLRTMAGRLARALDALSVPRT